MEIPFYKCVYNDTVHAPCILIRGDKLALDRQRHNTGGGLRHESRTPSAKLMQARWRISTETGVFPRERERESERGEIDKSESRGDLPKRSKSILVATSCTMILNFLSSFINYRLSNGTCHIGQIQDNII